MFALRRIAAPAARQAWSGTACTARATMATRNFATVYSKDHEWVEIDGNTATIGITSFAQDALGDLVYVELPEVGDSFDAGDSFASVESVKAASDVYAPCTGTITAVNDELVDNPALVNEDAEGAGWLTKFELSDPSELDQLLSREDYDAFCEEEADH